MTLNEYLNYALLKALAKYAERDDIKLVDENPRPRPESGGTVVMLRPESDDSAV
jgi:hypothetical protein